MPSPSCPEGAQTWCGSGWVVVVASVGAGAGAVVSVCVVVAVCVVVSVCVVVVPPLGADDGAEPPEPRSKKVVWRSVVNEPPVMSSGTVMAVTATAVASTAVATSHRSPPRGRGGCPTRTAGAPPARAFAVGGTLTARWTAASVGPRLSSLTTRKTTGPSAAPTRLPAAPKYERTSAAATPPSADGMMLPAVMSRVPPIVAT